MKQLSIFLYSVTIFHALTCPVNAQFSPTTKSQVHANADSVPRLTATCSSYFNGELKPRDGPNPNAIPGYPDLQTCAAVCINGLVNEVAVPPAPQCNDYNCLCHN
ncbi:MAG: hypothetical protein M1813_000383 [Trichoglossum hirsutum]|nr:MAG: hypothetical protein M1813_000383 [Trichoglossum hirsutum]